MPGQNFIDLFEGARRKRGANKRRMNVANAINAARPMPMNMPTQQPFNTGPGANGIVEPSKPVMLDRQTNPPSVYHEGETVVPFRGGKQIIPARTEGQQQRLASLQQAKGYPGYQTGGTVLNMPVRNTTKTGTLPTVQPITMDSGNQTTGDQNNGTQDTDQYKDRVLNLFSQDDFDSSGNIVSTPKNTLKPIPQDQVQSPVPQVYDLSPTSKYQQGMDTAYDRIVQQSQGVDPYMDTVRNRALQDYDARAATGMTLARQSAVSSPDATIGAQRGIMARQQSRYLSGLSDLSGQLAEASQQRMSTANREAFDLGRAATLDEQRRQEFQADYEIRRGKYDEELKDREWSRILEAYDPANPNELAYLQQQYMEKFGTDQPPSLQVLQEMRDYARRKREQDITMGEQAIDAGEIENMTSMERYRQMLDDPKWEAYNAALARGDAEDAAVAWQEITGRTPDMSVVKADIAHKQAMQAITEDAGRMANESAELAIDQQAYTNAYEQVMTGASWSAVKEELMAGGATEEAAFDTYQNMVTRYNLEQRTQELKLDLAEIGVDAARFENYYNQISKGATFDEVRDGMVEAMQASAWESLPDNVKAGFANYEDFVSKTKQGYISKAYDSYSNMQHLTYGKEDMLEQANLLLQLGGEENLRSAGNIFSQAFPGLTVNMDQLVASENRENFQEGMATMAKIIETFDSYEDAKVALENSGVAELLGIENGTIVDEASIQQAYSALPSTYKGYISYDQFKGMVSNPNQTQAMYDSLPGIVKSAINLDQFKDALGLADVRTTTDAMETMFDSMKLMTDPVYRMVSAMSDETITETFGASTPEEVANVRKQIGLMSTMGLMTIGPDGTLQPNMEGLTQLFGEGGLTNFYSGGSGSSVNYPELDHSDTTKESIDKHWTYLKTVAASENYSITKDRLEDLVNQNNRLPSNFDELKTWDKNSPSQEDVIESFNLQSVPADIQDYRMAVDIVENQISTNGIKAAGGIGVKGGIGTVEVDNNIIPVLDASASGFLEAFTQMNSIPHSAYYGFLNQFENKPIYVNGNLYTLTDVEIKSKPNTLPGGVDYYIDVLDRQGNPVELKLSSDLLSPSAKSDEEDMGVGESDSRNSTSNIGGPIGAM